MASQCISQCFNWFTLTVQPKKTNLRPIGISIVLSLLTLGLFYLLNQSITTLMHQGGDAGATYGDILTTAKWLIVAGILVKGTLTTLVAKRE